MTADELLRAREREVKGGVLRVPPSRTLGELAAEALRAARGDARLAIDVLLAILRK